MNRIPEPEPAVARTVYLARYPDSRYWVDFDDFSFYRMDVLDVYYVGGFGATRHLAHLWGDKVLHAFPDGFDNVFLSFP